MSGADYFDDSYAINPYMDEKVAIDTQKATAEHQNIQQLLESIGVTVSKVAPPKDCQDGVYTANWALCNNGVAVLSRLPGPRKNEEPYAQQALEALGLKTVQIPEELRFSGQGDALPCGDLLFAGSVYRTDVAVHDFLRDTLGLRVISLQTVPKRRWGTFGKPITNTTSGWPDSLFYDIDLALAVLRVPSSSTKGLIAWCPRAFTKQSRSVLRALNDVDKIEVNIHEAVNGFACNLVSNGEAVVMSAHAPKLQAELAKRGFQTLTPEISELAKGGGYIRCPTLTL